MSQNYDRQIVFFFFYLGSYREYVPVGKVALADCGSRQFCVLVGPDRRRPAAAESCLRSMRNNKTSFHSVSDVIACTAHTSSVIKSSAQVDFQQSYCMA